MVRLLPPPCLTACMVATSLNSVPLPAAGKPLVSNATNCPFPSNTPTPPNPAVRPPSSQALFKAGAAKAAASLLERRGGEAEGRAAAAASSLISALCFADDLRFPASCAFNNGRQLSQMARAAHVAALRPLLLRRLATDTRRLATDTIQPAVNVSDLLLWQGVHGPLLSALRENAETRPEVAAAICNALKARACHGLPERATLTSNLCAVPLPLPTAQDSRERR